MDSTSSIDGSVECLLRIWIESVINETRLDNLSILRRTKARNSWPETVEDVADKRSSVDSPV